MLAARISALSIYLTRKPDETFAEKRLTRLAAEFRRAIGRPTRTLPFPKPAPVVALTQAELAA